MSHPECETTTQQIQTLLIDHDAHEVTLGGNPIHLTLSEFTLLTTLADCPRRALSSQLLLRALTGSDWEGGIYSLRTLVSRLRSKLGESGNQHKRIVTVHGFGYRYESDRAPDLASTMASKPDAVGDSNTSAFVLLNLERRILWASDSFTHLLGWQPGELQSTSIYQWMHPDDYPTAIAARVELDKGIPAAFFIHLRNMAGQYHLMEAFARPILESHGNVTCFLGEFRSASAAQKAELSPPNPIYIGPTRSLEQGSASITSEDTITTDSRTE